MQRKSERGRAPAIVIMGVSGSGKSTLATVLAAKLGCPFLEGDDFHSAANVAKMRGGEPLTDADRWPWLDRLGAAIGAAAARDGITVATCSALKRVYRDRLRTAIALPTAFVLVTAGRGELARRLTARHGHYMPATLLDSQLAILERPDAEELALTLDGSFAPELLADQVVGWLTANGPEARQSAHG